MHTKKLLTPCGKVHWMEEHDIMYVEYTQSLTVDDLKEHMRLCTQYFDKLNQGPQLMISDPRNVKSQPSKEVRDYLKTEEVYKYSKAVAIMVKGGLSKLIINIFLSFDKPPHPTKVFSEESKAIQWLKSIK